MHRAGAARRSGKVYQSVALGHPAGSMFCPGSEPSLQVARAGMDPARVRPVEMAAASISPYASLHTTSLRHYGPINTTHKGTWEDGHQGRAELTYLGNAATDILCIDPSPTPRPHGAVAGSEARRPGTAAPRMVRRVFAQRLHTELACCLPRPMALERQALRMGTRVRAKGTSKGLEK